MPEQAVTAPNSRPRFVITEATKVTLNVAMVIAIVVAAVHVGKYEQRVDSFFGTVAGSLSSLEEGLKEESERRASVDEAILAELRKDNVAALERASSVAESVGRLDARLEMIERMVEKLQK